MDGLSPSNSYSSYDGFGEEDAGSSVFPDCTEELGDLVNQVVGAFSATELFEGDRVFPRISANKDGEQKVLEQGGLMDPKVSGVRIATFRKQKPPEFCKGVMSSSVLTKSSMKQSKKRVTEDRDSEIVEKRVKVCKDPLLKEGEDPPPFTLDEE